MKTLSSLLIAALLPLAASAALIVTDGSFENASDGQGGPATNGLNNFYTELDDWFEEANDFTEVAQNELANTNIPLTPFGDLWGNLVISDDGSGAIYQSLGLLSASDPDAFVISGILGQRSNFPFNGIVLEFYTDVTAAADGTALSGTFLDSATLSDPFPVDGVVATGPFAEVLSVAGASAGDEIWLRLSTLGSDESQNLIDGITVSAIPEPSTVMLLGLGTLLGAIFLRRRLRK
jgi:hypothetical protein